MSHLFFCTYLPDGPSHGSRPQPPAPSHGPQPPVPAPATAPSHGPQPSAPAPSPGPQPCALGSALAAVFLRPYACGLMLAVLCFWLCVFALCFRSCASGLVLQALCFRSCASGRAFADPFLCWCAGVAVVCHLPRSPYVSLLYRPGALLVFLSAD